MVAEVDRLGALEVPLSFTNQDIRGTNGNGGHNFNGTVDYRLGSKNVLSTGLLLNVRTSTDQSRSDYAELGKLIAELAGLTS